MAKYFLCLLLLCSSLLAPAQEAYKLGAGSKLYFAPGITNFYVNGIYYSTLIDAINHMPQQLTNVNISAVGTITTTSPLAGGGPIGNLTLSIQVANASQGGYITSTDWLTFNGKASTNTSITAGSGLLGGGTLQASRTLSLDWTTLLATNNLFYVTNTNPVFTAAVTNITSNAPWLTVGGQGTHTETINTNSTKLALNTFSDNNAAGFTNFPANVVLTNSDQTISGMKTFTDPFVASAYSVALGNATPSSSIVLFSEFVTMPGVTNLPGVNSAVNRRTGDARYVTNNDAAYSLALTNAVTTVPWLSSSIASRVATLATNSTKLALNTFSDNNAAGFTNFPANVMFLDGTRALTAALNAGGFSLTNLANGTVATAATTLSQLQLATNGHVTSSITNGLASTSYVDTQDGARVTTNRTLSVTAPITGGGALDANRTFGFDGTAVYNNSGATNLNASQLSSGTIPTARYGAEVVQTNSTLFTQAFTNATTTAPWLSIAGQGTRIVAINTNSTKLALNTFSDNNASGLTNFPANVVLTNRFINTTTPLSGGGNLASDLTLAIQVANASQNGYLTSTDWLTFNGKASSNVVLTAGSGLTGGGALDANRTFAVNWATLLATNNLFYVTNSDPTYAAAITNVASNVPWLTVTGTGTRVNSINTNSTKLALNTFSDNNASGLTNFPANVVLTNGNQTISGPKTFTDGITNTSSGVTMFKGTMIFSNGFICRGANVSITPTTFAGSTHSYGGETTTIGGTLVDIGNGLAGSSTYFNNDLVAFLNTNVIMNSQTLTGDGSVINRILGDARYVTNTNPAFVAGITNITSNAPWFTVGGQGTRVATINTNSTKLALNTFSDNNAAGLTNFPANIIQTNSTTFRWSQCYYIGQLANSVYQNGSLTLSSLGLKTVALYQTNQTASVPVWGVPADRLKGKSIIIKSLWVNYNGAGVSGNISVEHRIQGATNAVWIGGFSPYSGGNPHFTSQVTATTTVPAVTNQFFLITTNTIPLNATDAEASIQFRNDTTTFPTNLGLLGVYSEEIP